MGPSHPEGQQPPQRAVVAMSGGVDSSVTAALLKEQGYEVIGVTMRLSEGPSPEGGCCSIDDTSDARRVADRLGIPFYVLNYAEAFRTGVIDNFLAEYQSGRTPNPCARCNQRIKFDRLLHQAKDLQADYLATGHYAQIQRDDRGRPRLLAGVDQAKDQSYFLSVTPAKALGSLLFPIGPLTKERVRELASRYNLNTARKPESQDICFVPRRNHGAFLAEAGQGQALRPGEIVDEAGRVLGQHPGIAYYTVGQRRGLGIAAGTPLYVTAIDADRNRVVVGAAEALYHTAMRVTEVNWFAEPPPETGQVAEVKVRHRAKPVPATLRPEGNQVRVEFAEPLRAVTPGQVAAFYQGAEVLGGGWIEEVFRHPH